MRDVTQLHAMQARFVFATHAMRCAMAINALDSLVQ
jgi:hypothetical protein